MFTPWGFVLSNNKLIMATFKPCIRKIRTDGFRSVYIRCTHSRQTAYMRTDKLIDKKGLNKAGEIKDSHVMAYCHNLINTYVERLNKEDTINWTVKEIIAFLENADADVCISDYARKFKLNMAKKDMARTARNYEMAYNHLERFAGTTQLMFSRFTSKFIQDWITELTKTTRSNRPRPDQTKP